MAALAIDGGGWRRTAQAGGALAGRGLEAAGKFALYGLAARGLGVEEAGRFFLCLSVIHLVATLARLGLERPLTRHVAAERAVGAYDLAWRTALSGTGAVLAASLMAAAALWLAAPLLARILFHDDGLAAPLRAAGAALPLQNLAYISAYILIGLDRAATAQLVMNALAPCLLTGVLLVLRCGALELLWLYAAAFAFCGSLGVIAILSEPWRGSARSETQHEALEPLWRAGATLLPVELSQAALLSLPVMLVGAFAAPSEVSGFSIASRVSMLVATAVISIGAVAAPGFARHHRRREWAALKTDNRRALIASLALCLPAIVGMAILAEPVLRLMHAPLPLTARCLWVLLVGQLAFCLLPCQDMLLAMTGHTRTLRQLALIQVAVCIGASLLLIPALGAVGAALASAGVWTLGAVGCASAAHRLVWRAAEPQA
jgi:O-antigen/teichoic acid export membrane protein